MASSKILFEISSLIDISTYYSFTSVIADINFWMFFWLAFIPYWNVVKLLCILSKVLVVLSSLEIACNSSLN